MTDQKLYDLCKKYGENARLWRQKFLGLLPEVQRRERKARTKSESWLEQRGFGSIIEFAAKLAGVSAEQVRNVLNLERQFEDKPVLRSLLVKGQASVNKLVRIASIATRENDAELGAMVMNVSKKALETLVRDSRRSKSANGAAEQMVVAVGLQKPLFDSLELPGQPGKQARTSIEDDLQLMNNLRPKVKNKLLALAGKGVNISEIIDEALERRESELAQEKEEIAEQELAKLGRRRPKSRYLSVKLRRVLTKEYGAKCSIPGCKKAAENMHHTNRFALSGLNDPRFMAPLCAGHHEIAHAVDVKTRKFRRQERR